MSWTCRIRLVYYPSIRKENLKRVFFFFFGYIFIHSTTFLYSYNIQKKHTKLFFYIKLTFISSQSSLSQLPFFVSFSFYWKGLKDKWLDGYQSTYLKNCITHATHRPCFFPDLILNPNQTTHIKKLHKQNVFFSLSLPMSIILFWIKIPAN